MSLNFKSYFNLLCLSGLFWTSLTYSNVIMTGTRVIYPSDKREKTLQFSNNSDQSYVVQIWLDKDNENSSPETADAPFLVNPQIFRVQPNSGQMVRLVYTGDSNLPKDKESVFYINFKQIPSLEKNKLDENKLVLLVKSRLKVFYRPENILIKSDDVFDKLYYKIFNDGQDTWLEVENPTGYYVSTTKVTVNNGGRKIEIKNNKMLAPMTNTKWKLNKGINLSVPSKVTLRLVNDYGAYVNQSLNVK